MDLDGLEKLMKANHNETMNAIIALSTRYDSHREVCFKRFDKVEDDVEEHSKVIAKSKGIITIIGSIWAAMTTVAALVAPYFWR